MAPGSVLRTIPVAVTAEMMTGSVIGICRMGSITSFIRVCAEIMERVVPIDTNASVPSNVIQRSKAASSRSSGAAVLQKSAG